MAREKVNENKNYKQKKKVGITKTTTRKKTISAQDKEDDSRNNRNVSSTSNATNRKRRSKEAIAIEKAEKDLKKQLREEKRNALRAKQAERAAKKAERDARKSARDAAAKAKLDENRIIAETQKVIDSLKIDTTKYCKAVPMNSKEREHIKKILASPDLKWTIQSQSYGKSDFSILEHRENELVIKIDDVYYFYNKTTDRGINFGSVFNTWLDTCKKTPWTDKVVNIEKTEVENGDNSTPHKQVKRTRKSAK
jgi:hypothetical protein